MQNFNLKFKITIVAFLSLAGLIFAAPSAQAGTCFCAPNLQNVQAGYLKDFRSGLAECNPTPPALCGSACQYYDTAPDNGITACNDAIVQWEKDLAKLKGDVAITEAKDSKFIPQCVLENNLDKNSPCRDVGIFVILAINIANYLFAIIGALSLIMFIYGGFMFIISAGNPERVKKGTDAMLAAVIGIFVVFTAYLLVGFLGEVVGVKRILG